MKIRNKIIAIFALVLVFSSCQKDFLETAPTDRLSADVMFETTQGGYLALNGLYRNFFNSSDHDGFGHMAVVLTSDLMGEDMVMHSAGYNWFVSSYRYSATRNADAVVVLERWRRYYATINNANWILQNIDDANGPQNEKNNLKGQAYAVRAFAYYQLAQLYAPSIIHNPDAPGLPIYTASSQEGNPRSSLADVYAQIKDDLTKSIDAFGESTVQAHKSHISLPVAHGLMARAALASGDYPLALTHANHAIEKFGASKLFAPASYVPASFNRGSASEWMWGSVINTEQATIYASFMSHMDARQMSYASLGGQKKISQELYEQIPATDVRKSLFVAPGNGSGALVDRCQLKFGVQELGGWSADYVYMRLSEMYLIKAEAEARTGTGDAAQTLFDLVSQRDTEYVKSTNTGDALVDEILLQRRIELWGEGFRFSDIKRTNAGLNRASGAPENHSSALAVTMTLPPNSPEFVFKIPTQEIDANENISRDDQNL